MKRPYPPDEDVLPLHLAAFAPAPELGAWAKDTFCTEGDWLYNPDHAHLAEMDIGFIWCGASAMQTGKRVLGQAKLIGPPQQKWSRLMADWQLIQWFGHLPLAIIMIEAEYARECSDAQFCALVEHEMYHIGHATDEFGMPKYSRDGAPILGMRAHDVEEFIGVVRRYGAEAAGVQEMIQAAKHEPEMPAFNIARACGTCMARAA